MKKIAAIAIAMVVTLGGAAGAAATLTPVSESEAYYVTINPGRCIAVQDTTYSSIRTVCNYSKFNKTYWFPFYTRTWPV